MSHRVVRELDLTDYGVFIARTCFKKVVFCPQYVIGEFNKVELYGSILRLRYARCEDMIEL